MLSLQPLLCSWIERIGGGYLRLDNAQILEQGHCSCSICERLGAHYHIALWYYLLEIDIVMSSSLFMLITYYSVMTDTNECD